MKKSQIEKYFKGKKITQMGLGGFGRALKEAEFLLKYGADLIITDSRDEKTFPWQIKYIKEVAKKYQKNGSRLQLFLGKKQKKEHYKKRDLVFYPNGSPLDNPFVLYAKKNSKIVTKSVAFLYWIVEREFADKVKRIGVTGTKGKSTTTALIEKLLKKNGQRVFTCGNVRGSSNLPILEKIKEGDFLLGELDSWLLQGFGDLKISPSYSIFTNFFRDHQNYYHSMKKYFSDKANIFAFQKTGDYLILTNQSSEAVKKYFKKRISSKKIIVRPGKIPKWKYSLLGEHNKKNIAQALALADILKIPEKVQKRAMENFSAVEGRMEFLGKIQGVAFWNDNNSTTPDSSILTIQSLKKAFPESKIYLIGGGVDKDFNYKKFAQTIEKKIAGAFLFGGTATDKIKKYFKNFSFEEVKEMEFAVKKAFSLAQKGDIVLLSPGAASFGLFKNEYDRNDQFVKTFKSLKKNKK